MTAQRGSQARMQRATPALQARGLDRGLLDASVLAAGSGSLASCGIELLLRLGVRECAVVDFDTVDRKDLVQSAFSEQDLGRPKAEAARALGARIGSPTRVVPLVDDVRRLGPGTLRDFDLVFCALDSLEARLDLYEQVFAAGVPFLDGGVDGHDGRITEIAATGACFACGMQSPTAQRREPGWDRVRRLSAGALGCRAAADPTRPTIAAPYATRELAAAMVGRALHVLSGQGANQELRFGWTPAGAPRWSRFELGRSEACATCSGTGFDPEVPRADVPRLPSSARRDALATIEAAAVALWGEGRLEAPLPWSAFGARPPQELWSERPALELGVPLGGRMVFVRSSGERYRLELGEDGLGERLSLFEAAGARA